MSEASVHPPRDWIRPAILVAIFALAFVVARETGLSARVFEAGLRPFVRDHAVWAAAAFLGVFLVRPFLLLPITPFWVVAGVLFGTLEGGLLALVGTSMGAAVGFALARHLGRDFVRRRMGERARRWTDLERGGTTAVLALQLTPVMPHDLINSLAGVSRMPYRSFFVGSLVGTLPIIAFYAWVGDAVLAIGTATFWIALAALAGLTVGMLAWSRRVARRRAASLSSRWSPNPEVKS